MKTVPAKISYSIERWRAEGRPDLARRFPAFAPFPFAEADILALNTAERRELLDTLSYRHKYRLLEMAPDQLPLLRGMSGEDLLFTVDAAGRTDAMELILSSTAEQTMRILDLDVWDADRLREDGLLDWFGYLLQTDLERGARKIRSLDYTLILAWLAKLIQVKRVEWWENRDDIPADLATIDEEYTFRILNLETINAERLIVFMQHLYIQNFELYKDLMEALIWESPSGLEEAAYRDRAGRLADAGYPEYVEALECLAPLDPDALKRSLPRFDARRAAASPEAPRPLAVHRRLFDGPGLFARVLAGLDDPALVEPLRAELVALANRVAVARKAVADLEKLETTLEEARDALDLGLGWLADGDEESARRIAASAPLGLIHRCGRSLALRLAKAAKAFLDRWVPARAVSELALVPPAVRDVLLSLDRPAPLLPGGFSPDRPVPHPPASLAEYEKARAMLARTEFTFDLLFSRLGLDRAAAAAVSDDFAGEEDSPWLLMKVFLTAYARRRLELDPVFAPLTREQFTRFLNEALAPRPGGGLTVQPRFAGELADWTAAALPRDDAAAVAQARDWAGFVVAALDELAAKVSAATGPQTLALTRLLYVA